MLLLIISYLDVAKKCSSEAPKSDNFVVDVVVVVVVIVIDVFVVALLVITGHIIFSWPINVNLRLLKAVDFVVDVVVVALLVVIGQILFSCS